MEKSCRNGSSDFCEDVADAKRQTLPETCQIICKGDSVTPNGREQGMESQTRELLHSFLVSFRHLAA